MKEASAFHGRREATPDRAPSDVSHPLRGVVLCCTSIPPEKRTELASQAEQMGAVHKYDLTSEITHLIVGEYDTPKYRYVAKERPDVKVLIPLWIEAVRQLWMEDLPIDLDATEREYRLPTFNSLKLCLTGFEDPQRQEIIEQVLDNGGEYHGDLTKNITHLICHKAEGAKHKHAKLWGLQVVSAEWLHDSLERGMILDENLYNPGWPVEERGKDAWNRKRTSLGKRTRDENVPLFDEGKRKLRRTASTKLNSQNEKLWGDIVGSNNEIQAANSAEWGNEATAATILKEPHKLAKHNLTNEGSSLESSGSSCRTIPNIVEGTFSGCNFYIHGFDRRKSRLLEQHLLSHVAEISNTMDDLIMKKSPKSYVVVSHSTTEIELPEVPQSSTTIQIVTEWWVERCIGTKTQIDPADYSLGRPFPIFPLPRFEELTICSTGFEGLQLLHVSKVVALMGAKYEEVFSKNVSVLICNSVQNIRKEKFVLAKEWKIPAVSLDWLLESIQMGVRQRFSSYALRMNQRRTGHMPGPPTKEGLNGKVQDEEVSKVEAQRQSSGENAQPPESNEVDQTAFQDDRPIKIKVEESVSYPASPRHMQPLAEISSNSLRKSQSPSKVVNAVEPTSLLPVVPQQAINTAMTSLLAKTKNGGSHTHENAAHTETQEITHKKRAPSRILGRAASNVSAASASSVDSTASTGQAVLWPPNKSGSGDGRSSSSLRANIQLDPSLLALTRDLEAEGTVDKEDTQPPQTQMHYEDLESIEYQAKLFARIKGEKLVRKEKQRVATIASLDAGEAPRLRKGRALRERHSAGIR